MTNIRFMVLSPSHISRRLLRKNIIVYLSRDVRNLLYFLRLPSDSRRARRACRMSAASSRSSYKVQEDHPLITLAQY